MMIHIQGSHGPMYVQHDAVIAVLYDTEASCQVLLVAGEIFAKESAASVMKKLGWEVG